MGKYVTVSLAVAMVLIYLELPLFVQASWMAIKNFDPIQWFLTMFPYESKGYFAYQIVSFLWKGLLLERSIGSKWFAYMVLKLLLITEGMMIIGVQGLQLCDATATYLSPCDGPLWGILFGLYGFLLPTYQNRNALVIAAIFTAELAFVYFFYPKILLYGVACGTLAGLLCSYIPPLVASPLQQIKVQGILVWECQHCKYDKNGVFFHACVSCNRPRPIGD